MTEERFRDIQASLEDQFCYFADDWKVRLVWMFRKRLI